MEIDITVKADEAIKLVETMQRRLLGFQPAFEKARERLALAFIRNMMTSGSMVGGWVPEKPGPWSAAQGMPASLRASGRLEASITTLRGQPNEIGAFQATFGTDLPYAKFHQWGTEDMPSRKIVFEPEGFSTKFARDVRDHVLPSAAERKASFTW